MSDESSSLGTNPDLLTAQEAADYLRIPIGSLYVRISRKEIPCARLGRLLRLKKSDLDRLLHSQYQGAETEDDFFTGPRAS